MLMPKRVKYRKMFRGRMKGRATRGNKISFGLYGLMALEPAWVTARQIEAARIGMTRYIKRGGKVWIRIFPDKSYTKKPLETRMGKGKAPVEGWVAVIKPGRVMFEMDGVSEDVAKEAMRRAQYKLPIRTKFVTRRDFEYSADEKASLDKIGAVDPDAPTQVEEVFEEEITDAGEPVAVSEEEGAEA